MNIPLQGAFLFCTTTGQFIISHSLFMSEVPTIPGHANGHRSRLGAPAEKGRGEACLAGVLALLRAAVQADIHLAGRAGAVHVCDAGAAGVADDAVARALFLLRLIAPAKLHSPKASSFGLVQQ